ncbi:MAG: zinc-dependent metalloprotease [Actinobacteria bacterium]|nr:zinc-dependent metalloprotease [Actinomycetota bacterium]MBI3688576.1 zinc-dependent metalloprotease [Actinomycetota bacterium]
MTSGPFGFGLPAEDPDDQGAARSGGTPNDPFGMFPLFGELQKLLLGQGGPVNWELARQLATAQLAGRAGSTPRAPGIPRADRQQIAEAIRLADLWLDDVTTLPTGVVTTDMWTSTEWVDKTLPVWSTLCDPVAARVVAAMGTVLPEQARAQAGQLLDVLNSVGGLLFGAQVGQALAELADEVVSSTDVGLPLGPAGTAVLLPDNVAAFTEGLELPAEEVRLYLALREAAHHRLFGHVPWLRQRLLDTVDAYARGITVDTSAIERAMAELDPTSPESLQQALAGGMFEPQTTPEQRSVLARLETLLALVEGWVDTVVAQAALGRLPGAEALRETLRRRRASGGPAEQTFATLVGLELRPRRLRDAARLWQAVAERAGPAGRDAVWAHPDLLPSADDLDDPIGFAERAEADRTGVGPDDFPELGPA